MDAGGGYADLGGEHGDVVGVLEDEGAVMAIEQEFDLLATLRDLAGEMSYSCLDSKKRSKRLL